MWQAVVFCKQLHKRAQHRFERAAVRRFVGSQQQIAAHASKAGDDIERGDVHPMTNGVRRGG